MSKFSKYLYFLLKKKTKSKKKIEIARKYAHWLEFNRIAKILTLESYIFL
jgi:hypothetical protein